jgi:hypothetical protein
MLLEMATRLLHMAVIQQMANVAYKWQNLQTNGSNCLQMATGCVHMATLGYKWQQQLLANPWQPLVGAVLLATFFYIVMGSIGSMGGIRQYRHRPGM